MKISKTLPAIIVGLGLICSVAVGFASFLSGSSLIGTLTEDRLTALAQSHKAALKSQIQSYSGSLRSMVESQLARASLADFQSGWKKAGDGAAERMQKIYITDNPHPEGERHLLVEPEESNYYVNNHKVVHPIYQELVDQGLFSDAALANPDGFITYTFRKGPEFAFHVEDAQIQGHPVQIAMGKLFEASKNETLAAGQIYSSGFVTTEDGTVSEVLAVPVFYLDRFFGAIAFTTNMEHLAGLLNETRVNVFHLHIQQNQIGLTSDRLCNLRLRLDKPNRVFQQLELGCCELAQLVIGTDNQDSWCIR